MSVLYEYVCFVFVLFRVTPILFSKSCNKEGHVYLELYIIHWKQTTGYNYTNIGSFNNQSDILISGSTCFLEFRNFGIHAIFHWNGFLEILKFGIEPLALANFSNVWQ